MEVAEPVYGYSRALLGFLHLSANLRSQTLALCFLQLFPVRLRERYETCSWFERKTLGCGKARIATVPIASNKQCSSESGAVGHKAE
jgi:hypothetical protein